MIRSGPLPHAAIRCLALDDAAAAVYTMLADNGVAAVLLKGAGLARRLGNAHSRFYSDVDLLVAPSTFETAQELLLSHGYHPQLTGWRPDELRWYERPWRAPGPLALAIDLHRGFAGVTDPEAFWRGLSGTAGRMALAGCPVAVPSAAGAALVLGLHSASPGSSARPRGDLALALRVLPTAVWPAAADLARQVGAEPAFALGLRQVDAGAELASELGLPDLAGIDQRIRAVRGSPGAHVWAGLAVLPTMRARIRYLRLNLLPSRAVMRHGYPLARRGRAGFALAHLKRAGRLAWRTPSALRELRAVRRAIR